MTRNFRWWCVIAVVGIPLVLGSPALGQDVLDRDSWGGGEGLWTDDANWVDSEGFESAAPSPVDTDRWALVSRGNVIVDGDIGTSGLDLTGGSIRIDAGASLTVDLVDGAFSVGQTQITGGTMQILGDGKFSGLDATNGGTIEFGNPSASFETSGDFKTTGTLQLNITGDGTSTVKVGGAANIRGIVSPTFDGVSPTIGDAFPFVTGASSVTVGATVELPSSVSIDRGLDVRVEPTADGAALVFGNLPILQVDRVTGAAKIENAIGDPVTMTGYTIGSSSGLLNPDGLAGLNSQGVEGWEAPNPMTNAISEVNLTSEISIAANESISLGNAYNGGATNPDDEDVTFQFSTLSGDIIDGFVEYVGPANDFVANVNTETGEISLYNLSQHIGSIDVTGYQIISASDSLNVEAWSSLMDQGEGGWVEANPLPGAISELNLESSKEFNNPTVVSLGNIYKTDGTPDISVLYTTADALLSARVEYGEVPGIAECNPNTMGDVDGSGTVDFTDFLILSANFGEAATDETTGDVNCNGTVDFPDFLQLSANFGNTVPAGTAASVPEPSGILLLSFGVGLLVVRRRRQSIAA